MNTKDSNEFDYLDGSAFINVMAQLLIDTSKELEKVFKKHKEFIESRKASHTPPADEKKVEERKPLFVTRDNISIFAGDVYYKVFEEYDFDLREYNATDNVGAYQPIYTKETFGTKEKAEEYILLNKTLLTVNDIVLISWGIDGGTRMIDEAIKLAKQKIDNNGTK